MNNYVQKVYEKLLQDIEELPELKNVPVKSPAQVDDLVRTSITLLKVHFKANPFPEKSAEIDFFKHEKPAIIAEHIFAQELFTIESNKPIGDKTLTDHYYTRELDFIRRVFDQNRFLYQYYQLDGTEFDGIYFSLDGRRPEVNLPAAADHEPDFTTAGDFIFARFIAFERLQNHLSDILYGDKSNPGTKAGEPIRWTGDVINLVELIYGLHLTGQVNNGNASLNELVRWAERDLGVKIGIIQRRFAEIQGRKRIVTTKFIDQMRETLLHKIDDLSA